MNVVVLRRSSTSPYSFCWIVAPCGHVASRSWSYRLPRHHVTTLWLHCTQINTTACVNILRRHQISDMRQANGQNNHKIASTPTLQEILLRLQFLTETKFCLFPYQIKLDRKDWLKWWYCYNKCPPSHQCVLKKPKYWSSMSPEIIITYVWYCDIKHQLWPGLVI